uniref:Uncharacterized protein n=1 Tax=Globisporangium ultimum (strain ATCC 200006 / CBS 805.95 / DAOM BR144) TaxID=431595 RepID=K3X9S6_GLOUD
MPMELMLLPRLSTDASPVAPEWSSLGKQMTTVLKRIECVRIDSTVRLDGSRAFVVDVYEYASTNRIPTNRFSDPTAAPRSVSTSYENFKNTTEPIVCTQRWFAEFVDLRGQIYQAAHNAHKRTPCAFCKSVIYEIAWGEHQPGVLLQYFGPKKRVMCTLAKSVNAFLELVKQTAATPRATRMMCSGQEQVAQALYVFLFAHDLSSP